MTRSPALSIRRKPVVLTFVGNYLPGYKAGGILRTVVNTVDHLCDEFDFKVVTRDRDLGDTAPYVGVKLNDWQDVGNANVCYLTPDACTVSNLSDLVRRTPHDVLYLNSFFDPLTVKTLWNVLRGRVSTKRVIVAPRGEFAWASLRQKYVKKLLFMYLARIIRLYEPVVWHASSEFEAKDIARVMRVTPDAIQVAFDFPLKDAPEDRTSGTVVPPDTDASLRVVFLSRIAREKNLDYALRVLSRVKAHIDFDIYGPRGDAQYWAQCEELISRLPKNIKTRYLGSVGPNEVLDVFRRYDLFLFPTGGEAYGHVIAECLMTGTPILVSTETAWRDLEADGLGWDIDLTQDDEFVRVLEKFASFDDEKRYEIRATVKTKVLERLHDPAVREANRRLFAVLASTNGRGRAEISL